MARGWRKDKVRCVVGRRHVATGCVMLRGFESLSCHSTKAPSGGRGLRRSGNWAGEGGSAAQDLGAGLRALFRADDAALVEVVELLCATRATVTPPSQHASVVSRRYCPGEPIDRKRPSIGRWARSGSYPQPVIHRVSLDPMEQDRRSIGSRLVL